MEQYKYLAKNMGLLTLSSFATKLLSFFLVPLYTNILSTTEYGTFDLFNITVALVAPILTLDIQEATVRFAMDKKFDRKAIVSTSTKYFLLSNIIVIIGLLVNYLLNINSVVKEFSALFLAMFLTHTLSGIVTAYITGIGRVADLSVSSVFSSVAIICCNILFLVVCRWGIAGYFLANIIGPLIQCTYLIIRARIFLEIDFYSDYSKEKREMIRYSKPMIANSISWWVNNASDKYVVTFFCGVAENGIYSISSKIPSVLNIFQSIFGQAWGLSAVKDFDPDDGNGFYANTYAAYNCILTLICSVIIVTDKIVAKVLYAKNFYAAWRYVPWLTIAILFGGLAGYLGGFFSAVKNSKAFSYSTMIGAGANIALNIILTPFMGALGAAIATAVCYFIVWAIRFVQSRKIVKMKTNLIRDVISYIILVFQSFFLLIISESLLLYALEVCLLVLVALLYVYDINKILRKSFRAVVKGIKND